MLWRETLSRIAPRAREFYVKSFEDHGDAAFLRAKITTPLLQAHALAQFLHESGGLSRCEEALSYSSAERILSVYPKYFPATDRNAALKQASNYVREPERLANYVYDDRHPARKNKLGNTENGDGWKYRGRGMIQITGKANYARIGQLLNLDLVSQPDLINTADWAVDVACAFWTLANCNAPAAEDDLVGVTKRVNGGMIGLEDRIRWLAMVKRELGVAA